jgi:uncharacterized protein (TIRG00374 family)
VAEERPEHGHSIYEPSEFLAANEPIPEAEVSLTSRFLNWRTIASIVFGIGILVFLFAFVLKVNWGLMWSHIVGANPLLLLAALAAYYATFPLRGLRWWYVLRQVGTEVPYRAATQMLFLSWFVNCVVPAKLGDLYRAFLLRGNFGGSTSRTVGTIFIERIADVIVIATLALAAGFWSFRGRNRPEVDTIFLFGAIAALVLIAFVIALRFAGHRLTRFLPVRFASLWERFHEGSTGALTARSVPVIIGLTVAVWVLEGVRVFFVIRALGLPAVSNLGVSSAVFVALAAALVTAIPLTPAGVGFVEGAIVFVLVIYGVPNEPATAVALTDRAISIVTVIVLGGIFYAVSPLVRRAHGAGAQTAEITPSG